MWQSIAVAAISALTTTLVGITVNFFKNKSSKAKERRKQEERENLKGIIDESLTPIQKELEELKENNTLLKKAVQANIRVELRDRYNYYIKKKFAPTSIREDLEALYQAYHNLGKNGVMDNLREKFMELPVESPVKKNNKE